MPQTLKDYIGSQMVGAAKVIAVLTFDHINSFLALVIAVLSIVHLLVKIRKDRK